MDYNELVKVIMDEYNNQIENKKFEREEIIALIDSFSSITSILMGRKDFKIPSVIESSYFKTLEEYKKKGKATNSFVEKYNGKLKEVLVEKLIPILKDQIYIEQDDERDEVFYLTFYHNLKVDEREEIKNLPVDERIKKLKDMFLSGKFEQWDKTNFKGRVDFLTYQVMYKNNFDKLFNYLYNNFSNNNGLVFKDIRDAVILKSNNNLIDRGISTTTLDLILDSNNNSNNMYELYCKYGSDFFKRELEKKQIEQQLFILESMYGERIKNNQEDIYIYRAGIIDKSSGRNKCKKSR